MCRICCYIGSHSMLLADILTKPEHSILKQSKSGGKIWQDCGLAVNTIEDLLNHLARNSQLNGDGCGIGWYTDEDIRPAVFTSVAPAWNNKNLVRLTQKIRSRMFFGHVRAASPGSPISESNSHPFEFGRFMWMHNGCIAQFTKIKRYIISYLSDPIAQMITGTTDTEHAGALFMECLPRRAGQELPDLLREYTPSELKETMERAIGIIVRILDEYRLKHPELETSSSLNFVVCDGRTTIATRFRDNDWQDPPSLFYCTSSGFMAPTDYHNHEEHTANGTPCSPGACVRLKADCSNAEANRAVIISSEPLENDSANWKLVPKNHMVVVDARTCEVQVEPIAIPKAHWRMRLFKWLGRVRNRLAFENNSKALWRRNTSHHSLTPLSRQRTPLSPQKYSLIPRRSSTATAATHLHPNSAAKTDAAPPRVSLSTSACVTAHRSASSDAISAVGKIAASASSSAVPTSMGVRLEVPLSQPHEARLSTSADQLPAVRSAQLVLHAMSEVNTASSSRGSSVASSAVSVHSEPPLHQSQKSHPILPDLLNRKSSNSALISGSPSPSSSIATAKEDCIILKCPPAALLRWAEILFIAVLSVVLLRYFLFASSAKSC